METKLYRFRTEASREAAGATLLDGEYEEDERIIRQSFVEHAAIFRVDRPLTQLPSQGFTCPRGQIPP